MLTPEDVHKLVKNRNARQARAATRADDLETEQLDYIESLIEEYLNRTDYIDYVTDMVDGAVPQAVEVDLPLYVGFAFDHDGDFSHKGKTTTDYYPDRRSDYEKAWIAVISVKDIGIEDEQAIARALGETFLALYQDAGWETSEEVCFHYAYATKDESSWGSDVVAKMATYGFWLYY